jgi:alpha-D-ribose 1-methylphosphonate 5-triphosphate synthase subunit PhnH
MRKTTMTDLQSHDNDKLKAWQPLVQQAVFRQVMHAFSYPGRVETLCDADKAGENESKDMRSNALAQVLATLLDLEVTLADPDRMLDPHFLALLDARARPAESAQFIVARADRAPQFAPALGSLESPEQGATLILRVARIGEGSVLHLSGPGIDGAATLQVQGLDLGWLAARSNWNAGFPLGVDMILADAQRMVALPRTTVISCTNKGEH